MAAPALAGHLERALVRARVQALAAARAQNVRDYLLTQGVDPGRVFLGNAETKAANPATPSVLLNISVQ